MFKAQRSNSTLGSGFGLMVLIYHATVRSVRKTHGNAIIGLLLNMLQTVILVISFYVMMDVLGLRGNRIRGDFLLYVMSGIFMFMTHTKTINAVYSSEGPTSQMMKHAPMTTAVSIASAALSTLYIQVLSAVFVLYIYHVAFVHIEIYNMTGTISMLLLSWFAGVAIGIVLLALRPWAPNATGIVMQIFIRMNMIASGKMFVANTLPHKMLVLFNWNPLFHTIDQSRGFMFINYNPHFSSWHYALYVAIALLMIGLMAEFYTRQHASLSWGARQ